MPLITSKGMTPGELQTSWSLFLWPAETREDWTSHHLRLSALIIIRIDTSRGGREKRAQGQVSVSPVAASMYSHCHKGVMFVKWVFTWVCDSLVATNCGPKCTRMRTHRQPHVDKSLESQWQLSRLLVTFLWQQAVLLYWSIAILLQIELSEVPTLLSLVSFISLPWGCWDIRAVCFNISSHGGV